MVWSPSGSELVETLAWPLTTLATPLPVPTSGEPFSVKVTVPAPPTPPVTVAVNVTDWPSVANVVLGLTEVVVEVPLAGVMLRHQPASVVEVPAPEAS